MLGGDDYIATQPVDHHAFETHSQLMAPPPAKRPKRSIPKHPL
jgi:hypothetical protein